METLSYHQKQKLTLQKKLNPWSAILEGGYSQKELSFTQNKQLLLWGLD